MKDAVNKNLIRRLTILAFYTLTKKCINENKEIADFKGCKLEVPTTGGGSFIFVVSEKIALAFEKIVDAQVADTEKRVLEGVSLIEKPLGFF